jgi:aflatoxin B1 aldehyde reductase
MTFGEAGKGGSRTTDLAKCQEILDVFFAAGHTELDTARRVSVSNVEDESEREVTEGMARVQPNK